MKAKNFTLLIISFAFILSSQAQIEKGTKLLGGSFSFSHVNSDIPNYTTNGTTVSLFPSYGWATKNNHVTSVFIGVTYNGDNGGAKQYFYSLGIGKTRYFQLVKDLYITGKGSFLLTYSNSKSVAAGAGGKAKTYSASVDLSAGLAYKVNKRILAHLSIIGLASLGYNYSESKTFNGLTSVTTTANQYYLNAGLNGNNLGQIGIGFDILFN